MNLSLKLALYQSCCCNGYSLCGDCSFTIAGVVSGPSLLSAGTVSTACGTIGDFLIEWRVGSTSGPITLISGAGSDPDIQTTHPFTNEPVLAGELFPVLRYVEIDSVMYTTIPDVEGTTETSAIVCITPQSEEVMALNCSTSYNADVYYDFIFTYNAITSGTDKSREFKFELSPTTNYLAWAFTGYSVADGFEAFYCTTLDPIGTKIENWRIGLNGIGGTNYLVDPQIHAGSAQVHTMSNLSSFVYQSGDYIRLKITGSIVDPNNTNTNWQIKCKCFDNIDCRTCECADCVDDWSNVDVSTCSWTWDAVNCAYLLYFEKFSDCLTTLPRTVINMYTHVGTTNNGTTVMPSGGVQSIGGITYSQIYNPRDKRVSIPMYWSTTYGNAGVVSNSSSLVALLGVMTVTKTGSLLNFSFTNETDYLDFKSELQNVSITIPPLHGFVNDNTQVGYYQWYRIFRDSTTTVCGDNMTSTSYYVHPSANIVYDDINYEVDITLVSVSFGIPVFDCDNATIVANNSYISYINATYNLADFSVTATCKRNPNQISYQKMTTSVNAETDRMTQQTFAFGRGLIQDLCDLESDPYWCINSNNIQIYKYKHRIILTDPTNHNTRLNNVRLQQADDFPGGCTSLASVNWTTIWELQNGIQIIP